MQTNEDFRKLGASPIPQKFQDLLDCSDFLAMKRSNTFISCIKMPNQWLNNSKTSLRSMKYITKLFDEKWKIQTKLLKRKRKSKIFNKSDWSLRGCDICLWCKRWINSEYLIWKIATCSFTLKILKLFRFEVYSLLFEGNCKLISKLWYRNLNH